MALSLSLFGSGFSGSGFCCAEEENRDIGVLREEVTGGGNSAARAREIISAVRDMEDAGGFYFLVELAPS